MSDLGLVPVPVPVPVPAPVSAPASGPRSPDELDAAELAALTDEQVVDELATWAGRVAAGQARLLAYVGELDRREAWAAVGVLSCAHWLSWRLGMGLPAAYERVRAARALRELPETAAAFGAGRLSFSQVRAITRVAGPGDEQVYLSIARHTSGGQLERLARGVRRARRSTQDAADPELAAHRLRTRIRYEDDGTLMISARLPAEHGALVLAALEAARAEIDHQHRTEIAAEPKPAAGDFSAEENYPQDADAVSGQAPRATRRRAAAAGAGLPGPAAGAATRRRPPHPGAAGRPGRPAVGAGPGCTTASCYHPRPSRRWSARRWAASQGSAGCGRSPCST